MAVKAGQHYRIQIDYVQESGYGALNFDIQHKSTPTPQELLAQVGDAETIIFIGGISPRLEGEEMRVSEPGFRGGDRTSIELPQAQRDVIRWLHEAGKKVIFVNCSGGAVAMVPELETCDAILQWWYAGEQGGTALADVLTGRYNPSGKLPVTFYKSTDDLPDFLDYTMKNFVPLWSWAELYHICFFKARRQGERQICDCHHQSEEHRQTGWYRDSTNLFPSYCRYRRTTEDSLRLSASKPEGW